jgi:hypothetical protein
MRKFKSPLILVLSLCWQINLYAADLSAKLNSHPKNKNIYLGQCKLSTDPTNAKVSSFQICLKSSSGIALHADSHAPKTNANIYTHQYLGTHISQYFSIHFKGSAYSSRSLDTDSEKIIYDPRLVIFQIGNSAIHHFRAKFGYQNLPLGLNFNPFEKITEPGFEREIWETPKTSAILTWGNQFDVQVNLGVASTEKNIFSNVNHTLKQNLEHSQSPVTSLQALFDVSSLDGTRFSLSGYSSEQGIRKLSIGMLNVSRKGEKTAIEWIRKRKDPQGKKYPFEQIIRISYQGRFKNRKRVNFLFDQVRKSHRIGIIGQDFKITDNLLINSYIKYLASDDDIHVSSWAFSLGGAAQL